MLMKPHKHPLRLFLEWLGDEGRIRGLTLNVLSVGGAGHVAVDLLGGGLVLRLELGLDERRGLAVLLGAWKTIKNIVKN